jgi:hypothetical protein
MVYLVLDVLAWIVRYPGALDVSVATPGKSAGLVHGHGLQWPLDPLQEIRRCM